MTQINRSFLMAPLGNMAWINASEVWRYFSVIRPKLQGTFAGDPSIGAMSPSLILSWIVWDTVLILAATGFYWLYAGRFGANLRQAALASLFFTLTVFGLLWLGAVNMGLVPASFIGAALPLAWAEQFIAALIVCWFQGKERRDSDLLTDAG